MRRELCGIRDGTDHLTFDCNYKAVIESLCISILYIIIMFCNLCLYFVPLHMSTYNKDIIIIIIINSYAFLSL